MTPDADFIVTQGVVGLSPLYAASTLSPVDVFSAYLQRIEAINGRLNAFLFVDLDGARAAAESSAKRWRTGASLSALDGAPIAIKANIAVQGWPWHAGIAAYGDRIATEDADCVAKLRAAGAILLGVLNMDEAALGASGDNLTFRRCRNPHDLARTPGGSSSGSAAAVTGGLCAAALGTDTMGSVRIPASYCGAFGHKPRLGAIATAGVTPLSWTLDTIGVLARRAEDAGALLSVLQAGLPPVALPNRLGGLRLAALDFGDRTVLEAGVLDAFQVTLDTARTLGAEVQPIPLLGYDLTAVRRAALLVAEVEGLVEHQATLTARPDGFTPGLSALFAWGAGQSAPRRALAYRCLTDMGRRVREVAAAFDAVLTPTTPQAAFLFDAASPVNQADFTLLANVSGLAATAFPAGATPGGLPLSVQAMASDDAAALRLAATLTRPSPAPPFTGVR